MAGRVGYLTDEQFVAEISGTMGTSLAGTFQPLDATLTDLASRDIGTATATDILDRAAGDGRYALVAAAGVASFNTRIGAVTLTSADVTTALTYTPTSVAGLTGTQTVAAFKTGLTLVKADVGLGNVDNTSNATERAAVAALTNKDLTSGTNTFPTLNQNTTGSAASLTTGHTIAITGDLTYTSPTFDGSSNVTAAGTLATVNSNVGPFGSATQVATFTVNAKGLTTAAANVAIAIPSTQVTDFTEASQDATGAMVDTSLVYVDATPLLTRAALTGDATASQGSNALTLATVNSNVGPFGSATQVGTFTVNAKGLTTAAANVTITPAVGSITGLGTGVGTALAVNVGSAGAFVTFNGGLGTPSSGTLTNCTFPTLNQNTTGSAATLTTSRNFSITGGGITAAAVGFNGSAAVALSASVDAGHITLARMADMATASLLGRNTAGTGSPEVLSASTSRSLLGLVIGTNVQAWDADLDAVASSGLSAAWQSWTPTWTNLTVGNGTVTAKYVQVGKLVFCRLLLVFGTTTSVSGFIEVSRPVNAASYGGTIVTPQGLARFWDTSASTAIEGRVTGIAANSATRIGLVSDSVSGGFVSGAGTSSTSPFTWATGDELMAQFFYEAA